MSILPTAHASLGFGRRTVEFYAISGHVIAPEGRTRNHERSIQSADGERHGLRLSGRAAPMETGDTVTVLRMQAGPNRRSRPVAAINHDRREWTRTAPDATTFLARAGVMRGQNWLISMLVLILAAVALAWPELRTFLIEVSPGLFGAAPAFDVFEQVSGFAPALTEWRPASLLPADVAVSLEASEAVGDRLDGLLAAIALLALGLLAFGARTWRFIWIPLYVGLAAVFGLVLAAPSALTPALAALVGLMALFVLAGLVNRIRDSARFEARVTRLSEHLLRHPPEESVSPARPPAPAPALAAETERSPAPVAGFAAAASAAEPAAGTEPAEAQAEAVAEIVPEDDLPSDEELAAARAALAAESGAPAGEVPLEETDRDMTLPPPPPMPEPASARAETPDSEPASEPESGLEPGLEVQPDPADSTPDSALTSTAPEPAPAYAAPETVPDAQTQAEPGSYAEADGEEADPLADDDDDPMTRLDPAETGEDESPRP